MRNRPPEVVGETAPLLPLPWLSMEEKKPEAASERDRRLAVLPLAVSGHGGGEPGEEPAGGPLLPLAAFCERGEEAAPRGLGVRGPSSLYLRRWWRADGRGDVAGEAPPPGVDARDPGRPVGVDGVS